MSGDCPEKERRSIRWLVVNFDLANGRNMKHCSCHLDKLSEFRFSLFCWSLAEVLKQLELI